MKTIQLITLTATLALAACGKDNIPDTPADNGELKIIATIAASPDADVLPAGWSADTREIGRASCRERVYQLV